MKHRTEMEKIERLFEELGYKKVSVSYSQGVIYATFISPEEGKDACVCLQFGTRDCVMGEVEAEQN